MTSHENIPDHHVHVELCSCILPGQLELALRKIEEIIEL